MTDKAKHCRRLSLKEFLPRYKLVVIPGIQRDYVMGSDKEKLTKLLNNMYSKQHQLFDFGCIMGYEEDGIFYVYDGQQRLVTIVFLYVYRLIRELGWLDQKEVEERVHNLGKFRFQDKPEANLCLQALLAQCVRRDFQTADGFVSSDSDWKIVDFTTWSIDRLLKNFENFEKKGYSLGFGYFYERVQFELVTVDKADDAEQFFLDLNDGVLLEDYEIAKARLIHHAKVQTDFDEFEDFALALDNRWLMFFRNVCRHMAAGPVVCEEELEVRFLYFCLRMMWIEENGSLNEWKEEDIEWIQGRHLSRLYGIMNRVTELQLPAGDRDGCPINYSINNAYRTRVEEELCLYTGFYWNLADTRYDSMLKSMLCFLAQKENRIDSAFIPDAVLWGYVSNLQIEEGERNEYLRFLKKILNYNRIIRTDALFDGDIYYTKYSVYGIPEYYLKKEYGKRLKENSWKVHQEGDWRKYYSEKAYLFRVITMNRGFGEEFDLDSCLQKLTGGDETGRKIGRLICQEKRNREGKWREDIEKLEDLPYINGLADNLLEEDGKPSMSYEMLTRVFDPDIKGYRWMENVLFDFYVSHSGYLAEKYPSVTDNKEFYLNIGYMKWYTYFKNEQKHSGVGNCIILPRTWCDFFTEQGRDIGELFNETESKGEQGKIADYIRNYTGSWKHGKRCNSFMNVSEGRLYRYCQPYYIEKNGDYASINSNNYSMIQENS